MISIGVLAKALFGSFIGRAMAIGLAALAALTVNNVYQRSVGRQQGEIRAIEKVKDANETATQAGQKAANKSGNPAPRSRKPRRLSGYRD